MSTFNNITDTAKNKSILQLLYYAFSQDIQDFTFFIFFTPCLDLLCPVCFILDDTRNLVLCNKLQITKIFNDFVFIYIT